MGQSMVKRLGAEFLGTFWLVFGGCGSAVFAAVYLKDGSNTGLGIGFAGVSLAFGLTVLTMAYAVGHISGGHFNPAVTIGLGMAKRFAWKDAPAYIVTQLVAGLAAGGLLLGIANGKKGFSTSASGLAANGYGAHSPGGYSLWACFIAEVVLTAFFLYVILGATDSRGLRGFAPIAIGFALTLIHLISIPIDNTSVNPARSMGVAFFAGNGAAGQLWLFLVAPIVGGLFAGATYRMIVGEPDQEELADAPADPAEPATLSAAEAGSAELVGANASNGAAANSAAANGAAANGAAANGAAASPATAPRPAPSGS